MGLYVLLLEFSHAGVLPHVPIPLPSATGQLAHILLERQRSQFEPFDHRQVWMKRVSHVLHSQPKSDGEGSLLNHLTCFGCENVCAHQSPGFFLSDQLNKAFGIPGRQRPRDMLKR